MKLNADQAKRMADLLEFLDLIRRQKDVSIDGDIVGDLRAEYDDKRFVRHYVEHMR